MKHSISGVHSRDLKKNVIELDSKSVDLMGTGELNQLYLLGILETDSTIRDLTLVINLAYQIERLYYRVPIENPVDAYLEIIDLSNKGKKDIGVWALGKEPIYYVYFNQGDGFRLGRNND